MSIFALLMESPLDKIKQFTSTIQQFMNHKVALVNSEYDPPRTLGSTSAPVIGHPHMRSLAPHCTRPAHIGAARGSPTPRRSSACAPRRKPPGQCHSPPPAVYGGEEGRLPCHDERRWK